jgi:hypothetical protein
MIERAKNLPNHAIRVSGSGKGAAVGAGVGGWDMRVSSERASWFQP